MVDFVFLMTINEVTNNYSIFFTKLLSWCKNDSVWEHTVKLGNELEYLKATLAEENEIGYCNIEFRVKEHIKKINNYIDFLTEILETSKDDFFNDLLNLLKDMKEKFLRGVTNHNNYYKKIRINGGK